MDYPILSDPTGKVAKAYKIYLKKRGFSRRVTFFISPAGKVAHVITKVKTATHGKDIAKQLEKMGVKKKKKKKKA